MSLCQTSTPSLLLMHALFHIFYLLLMHTPSFSPFFRLRTHTHTCTHALIRLRGCSGIRSMQIATLDAVRWAYRKRSRSRWEEGSSSKGKSALLLLLSLVLSSRFILPSATSDIYLFLPFSSLSTVFLPICFPSLLILPDFLQPASLPPAPHPSSFRHIFSSHLAPLFLPASFLM